VPQGAHTWLAQMPLQQSLNVVQASPPSWQLAPPPVPLVVVAPPVPVLFAPVPVDVVQLPSAVQEVLVLPHAAASAIGRRGNDSSVHTEYRFMVGRLMQLPCLEDGAALCGSRRERGRDLSRGGAGRVRILDITRRGPSRRPPERAPSLQASEVAPPLGRRAGDRALRAPRLFVAKSVRETRRPAGTPFVIGQIDKTSLAILSQAPQAPIDTYPNPNCAFAFWGGDFFIFVGAGGSGQTDVFHYKAATDGTTEKVQTGAFETVGAGVSICAPTVPPM
jgi:hypothetical protein